MAWPLAQVEPTKISDPPRAVRSADRKRAKRAHPDKTADDRASAAFDALRDAYELLLDPALRAEHDEVLAREDHAARLKRQRRLEVAGRTTLRALRATAQAAWAHPRVAAGVAVLLYLRFLL